MYNRGDFAAPAAAARQQHREPAGPQGSKLGGCETSRHQLELSGKKQTNSQLAMSIKRSWRGELLSLFGPTFRYQQTRKTIFTTIFRSCSNQKPMGFSPHHRTRSLRSVASKNGGLWPSRIRRIRCCCGFCRSHRGFGWLLWRGNGDGGKTSSMGRSS